MKRPISEISSRLASSGFKTSILFPKKLFGKSDSSLHHSNLVEKSKTLAYSVINPPLSSEQPIPITLVFFIDAFKVLRENDVVHMWVPFYLSNTFIAVTKLLFFRKKKLILTMDTIPGYSFSMGGFMDFLFKAYYRTIGKLVFAACDKVTLYGDSFVPFAVQAGIPREKIVVTPTGVDLAEDAGKEGRAMKDKRAGGKLASKGQGKGKPSRDIRREFGIKKNEKLAVFVGLTVPRKGIDLLMDIAEKVGKEKIRFLVVGDGPGRKRYERDATRRGIGEKVIFTGFRRDVHNFYKQADLFLFPSRGEGLPGVVMEAMSQGLPIVASDIPGTRDLIENGVSGFLCPVERPECYAKAVKQLLGDQGLAEKLAANARKKIAKDYSWDKNIKGFVGLY
jgi:glycosyltransferase involved in cell wall biosynthesis